MGPQQVAANGVRTGLMTVPDQLLADLDDLVLDLGRGLAGTAARPPRTRLKTGLPFGQVPLHHHDHPAAGHPVLARDRALGPALDQDRGDHQLRHPHRSPLRSRCERCPETPVNDVLNSDTTPSASDLR